jgi:phosphoribosylamine--glycine ligase
MEGKLKERRLDIIQETATTVMLVSGGYPGGYEKGKIISGLNKADADLIFHAGTAIKGGSLVTAGGRVLALTSLHQDWRQGLEKSYTAAEKVAFDGMYYRKDIGFDL